VQHAWVRVAGVDSDFDGHDDRVHVQVVRVADGQARPVVVEASPYWAGGNPVRNHDVDVPLYVPPHEPRTGAQLGSSRADRPARRLIGPSAYEQLLRHRGYTWVYAESLGTGDSTGCPTSGGRNETLGAAAVVDWLAGRASARDADDDPVRAWWSDGRVGMIGVSYNGTLPNAVASTGVRGLRTIVPVSAISSWYGYYRAGGSIVAPGGYQGEDTDVLARYVLTRDDPEQCHRVTRRLERRQDRITGDSGPFWAGRNYRRDADQVRASVLVQHGLQDWNVKTSQFSRWYAALRAADVPHKVWLHSQGHGDWPLSQQNRPWQRTLVRWFDRWLHGVKNGVMEEPRAAVAHGQGAEAHYVRYDDWPHPRAQPVALTPTAGGPRLGGLEASAAFRGSSVTETLVDDAQFSAQDLLDTDRSPHRLLYRSPILTERVVLSGTPTAHLRLSFSEPAGNVSVGLADMHGGMARLLTEGWTDPQNRRSVRETTPVHRGHPYALDVTLQPVDHVLDAGHRLGLVVLSSDHDFTLRPPPGTRLSLHLDDSTVEAPVVGGQQQWADAVE